MSLRAPSRDDNDPLGAAGNAAYAGGERTVAWLIRRDESNRFCRKYREAARGSEMRLDKRDHKPLLVLWATACAKHVLPYFEESYPMDYRLRKALEAWVRGEVVVSGAHRRACRPRRCPRRRSLCAPCCRPRRGSRRRDRLCWYSRCAHCQLRCNSRDRRSRPHRLCRCHRQGT
jgi:hypothetical protein